MPLSELREKAAQALAQGRLPEAAELYRQWTEREPRRSEAYLGLGRSLLGMGYTDRARSVFLHASQLRPDLLEAKIGVAESYLQNGQADQAYELLSQVRQKDPSNPALNVAMASYYRMMGRNDLRRGFLEKALRQDPTMLAAILELAVLAAEEGRIQESERRLEQAALISPDALSLIKKRAEIHYRLSYSKYGQPQLEKARRYYRMYLHAAGDDPAVIADLIHVEYLLGHAGEAKALSERLDRSDIERRSVLHANILEAVQGDVKELVASLQVACERNLLPLSCFRFEEALIRHDRNHSLQRWRLQRMKARMLEARRRRARNRSDAEEFHLSRAFELYSEDLSLRKQLLERYRLAGAYEDYLRTLTYLRDREPNEHRWNTRLREALRSRRSYLPYRVGLEEADYARHPQQILIFDLRADRNSMEHYREPALLASFLSEALRPAGRWQVVNDRVRSGLQRRLPNNAAFLFYDAAVPDLLTGMGVRDLDAMLEGSYDLRGSSLRLRLRVRNRDGIVLGSFSDHAATSDVDLLATRVVDFLDRTVPLRASVIDVKNLIVNVGKADGLKKEELLRSITDRDIILKVEETSRYVSRVSLLTGRADRIGKGMVVERVVRR